MTSNSLAYPAPTYPHHPFASRLSFSMVLGLGLGFTAALLAILLGGLVYLQQTQVILPGVNVRGVSLGLMRPAEAEQTLIAAWLTAPPVVLLTDGEHIWQAPATQLGLGIDARATVQRAQTVGRGNYRELIALVEQGLAVEPTLTLDPQAARQALNILAAQINVPAQDAGFRLENGQVVATSAQTGLSLDVEATLALLSADPALAVKNGYLPIIVHAVTPRYTDVSPLIAQVSQWLAAPLTIQVYDPLTDALQQWAVPPEQIAAWIEVAPDGRTATLAPDKIESYVAGQSLTLGQERYLDTAAAGAAILTAVQNRQTPTLIVRHSPTTYIVQAGDSLTQIGRNVGMPYWRILEANPGLAGSGLQAGQAILIPSKDDLLPLPIVLNKRIVISISQQRLWTYANRQLLNEYVISTGIDRSPTHPGVFQIQTHELNAYASLWNLWMPHFLGIYEASPDFMNGLHGLPTLSSGRQLWADVLGRPASYGCIILGLADAETVYTWAENGVVVEIQP